MADPIEVDSHAHLYHSREEGQADKDGYEIWEYGSKSGVSFGDRLGTVDEALAEMEAAGISKAVVVNLDQCVMCASQDALFLGYDCLLVEDCAGATSPDFCRAATYDNIETDGFRASIASHRDRYDSPAS